MIGNDLERDCKPAGARPPQGPAFSLPNLRYPNKDARVKLASQPFGESPARRLNATAKAVQKYVDCLYSHEII